MNGPADDVVAAEIRAVTTDAATRAIGGFVSGAGVALGTATVAFIQANASSSSDAITRGLIEGLGTSLLGDIVTDLDTKGLDVGDVHVSTHLAAFAQGVPATSPIDAVSYEHAFPFALGTIASVTSSGTLTLHASCALDAETRKLKTSASGKITLTFTWSSDHGGTASDG
jgi:hypothetical protein